MSKILALFCFLMMPLGAEFRASVVKVDITPSTPKWLLGYGARQSTGVHDPIFHRIVALDELKGQSAIIEVHGASNRTQKERAGLNPALL